MSPHSPEVCAAVPNRPLALAMAALLAAAGCLSSCQSTAPSSNAGGPRIAASEPGSLPSPTPVPVPTPTPAPHPVLTPSAPALPQSGFLTPTAQSLRSRGRPGWDSAWDRYILDALPSRMLSDEAPVDVKNVCPRFFQLETSEKRLFWAYFLQAVAVPESGLQRSNRFRERGIPGIDSVTGLPIWSEGLLQLSYQDTRNHGCGFDWQRDRNLDRDDPDKSIFDPKLNLECGVKILEHQLFGRNPRPLFPSRHYYWSTLTRTTPPRGAYAQVLRELRSAPGFCTR